MGRTLTVTLNPTIDITTSVERLVPREKLRCTAPRYDSGGGGLNVAKILKALDGDCVAFVALAGSEGARLRRLLESAGIPLQVAEIAGETRLALQVVERSEQRQFRFILPGPQQDEAGAARLFESLTRFVADNDFDYVVLSGSLTPGLGDDFYGRIAQVLSGRLVRVILDSSGPALAEALGKGLFLIKPDEEELREIAQAQGVSADDPEEMARRLLDRSAAEVIVVTLGAEGVLLASGEDVTQIASPEVEVRSTVGAGDSFVGALVHALSEGKSLTEACRFGAAAGAAAVLTEATELAHREDIERLYREMG